MAIKILEDIAGNEEEIEDEYLALRDLSLHANIPSFHGIYFVKGSKQLNDQLWFVMEVSQSTHFFLALCLYIILCINV